MQHDPHDHDGGLATDLPQFLQRRRLLQMFGGGAVLALAGGAAKVMAGASRSTSPTTSDAASDVSTVGSGSTGTCTIIAEETAGPFPGDGSNGPNVLAESGIVRSDIAASFGESTTVAEGVPLTVSLVLTDTSNGCVAFAGAAVYIWHCDREGRYSMYSDGVTGENYLRGVQEADANGTVTFTSIFPGAYPGRWPHIHFEVYATVDEAVAAGEPIATSQLAFPRAVCEEAYGSDGYDASVGNLAAMTLEQDGVFGDDGGVTELATMTGDLADGIIAELAVGVHGNAPVSG